MEGRSVDLERPSTASEVRATIEPDELLLDFLRERLGLTGAKRSCDVQVCGTCTVLVDGGPVSACTYLAVDAHGRDVLTVEGFAQTAEFAEFEAAFVRHAALQCGYCTPGLLLTIKSLRDAGELVSEERHPPRARRQHLPLHGLSLDPRGGRELAGLAA